jgi:hypothetical protein
MEPAVLAVTMQQGASWRRQLTLNQPGTTTPYDLTGCTAKMQVRQRPGAPDPALMSISEQSGADGVITLGGVAGTIDVFFNASATNRLATKKAAYDLFLSWPNGTDVWKVLEGTVAVDLAVTEPSHV